MLLSSQIGALGGQRHPNEQLTGPDDFHYKETIWLQPKEKKR
jgi:hypothetical protein